ncbi:hypothetical protein [Bacteroides sedimenti]|uniref:Lipoprotein n=1 Tax=Bacteroides sedimenti TaxID=2136147 RepID=A0ABM8IGS6_9BACE
MKSINFITLLCCALLIMCSCNKNKISIDEHFIKLVSRDIWPSKFERYPFYCKGENGKILEVRSRDLRMLYDDGSFDFDYLSFLKKVLNQKMELQSQGKVESFYLDKYLEKAYRNIDFKDFMRIYCIDEGENRFRLKKGFTYNQKRTIFYFLFINNYLSCFDDYAGVFWIFNTNIYNSSERKK